MELKLKTEIGELTGVFQQDILTSGYTAWFKEKDNIIAQGDNLTEAIDNLHEILNVVLEFEKEDEPIFGDFNRALDMINELGFTEL